MAYQVSEVIEKKMSRRLQRLIRKKNLIDTGALWRSIDITAEVDDAGFIDVKIYSEDYLKYLDERFTVTSDFVNARGFKELVREIYEGWIPYMIKKYPLLSGFEKVLNNVGSRVSVEIVN